MMRDTFHLTRSTENFYVYETKPLMRNITVVYIPQTALMNPPSEMSMIITERIEDRHQCNCAFCSRKER